MKPVLHPGGLELTKENCKNLPLDKSSKVLDIGCGLGTTLEYLVSAFHCQAYGIDLSEACISSNSVEYPDIHFSVSNACDLPYEDEMFDAVFMECVLTLTDDPAKALSEDFRVLKPGGTLVLSSLTHTGDKELLLPGTFHVEVCEDLLHTAGFSAVTVSNHSSHLIQFVADMIFRYGSIDAYLRKSTCTLGGTVLNCNLSPKNTSYHSFLAVK